MSSLCSGFWFGFLVPVCEKVIHICFKKAVGKFLGFDIEVEKKRLKNLSRRGGGNEYQLSGFPLSSRS